MGVMDKFLNAMKLNDDDDYYDDDYYDDFYDDFYDDYYYNDYYDYDEYGW